MPTFTDKLKEAGTGKAPAVAALTFLSDLGSEDRVTLHDIWPTLPTDRRYYIVNELVHMAEDNIELHFRHVFLNALQDEDGGVRQVAIEGLFEDESKLLLGRLLTIVQRDPDEHVREAAAKALGRFTFLAQCSDKFGSQGDKLRQDLIALANDENEDEQVRRRVVEALGYFQGDPEIEQLIARTYESGGVQSESAIYAMGRSLDERWHQVVLDEMGSHRAPMRYEAARAAGEMTLADALPFLSRLVTDKDTEVKLAAIWALGQIGGKPATEALNEALKSNEPAVREAAQVALDEMAFNADPLNVGS